MHSGQHIKTSNHQAKLVLTGLEVGQIATLTPVGAEAGVNVQKPIEFVGDHTVVIDGHVYKDYMGSMVRYNDKLHTLDLPSPEQAAVV